MPWFTSAIHFKSKTFNLIQRIDWPCSFTNKPVSGDHVTAKKNRCLINLFSRPILYENRVHLCQGNTQFRITQVDLLTFKTMMYYSSLKYG